MGRRFGSSQFTTEMNRNRRPFWVPASTYYMMTVALSAALFFVAWGILNDSLVEAPHITAGISASIFLFGAVVLREIILRRARNRLIQDQRRLERSFVSPSVHAGDSRKLTIERNAAILNDIKRKSEAARVLGKFSAGHREVFELCGDYILQNDSELKVVSASSPRLSPLLKGRTLANELHRFHMLKWAEIEVTSRTTEASTRVVSEEKIEAAQGALAVIDESLEFYPAERSLIQSRALLQDLLVSIKVSDRIEQAERAVFEKDYALAKSLYRDALFDLGRDNVQSAAREAAAARINAEIERIRILESDR